MDRLALEEKDVDRNKGHDKSLGGPRAQRSLGILEASNQRRLAQSLRTSNTGYESATAANSSTGEPLGTGMCGRAPGALST